MHKVPDFRSRCCELQERGSLC